MFDIVIDYPDSTPALHDLKVSELYRNDVLVASHPNNCGVPPRNAYNASISAPNSFELCVTRELDHRLASVLLVQRMPLVSTETRSDYSIPVQIPRIS